MSKFRRTEDEADLWLREHDPYYSDTRKSKKKHIQAPYETPEQERRRREAEIPISNLTKRQRQLLKSVAGNYNEDGDFNL